MIAARIIYSCIQLQIIIVLPIINDLLNVAGGEGGIGHCSKT